MDVEGVEGAVPAGAGKEPDDPLPATTAEDGPAHLADVDNRAKTGGVAAGSINGNVTVYLAPPMAPEAFSAYSAESAALTESVAVPLADIDVTRQLHGRDTIVDFFAQRLREPGDGERVHLLHGLGGSGKTSIARKVARRAAADDVTVWWVSATDKASFVSGMHAVARLVGTTTEELQAPTAVDTFWRRLGAVREPWLLVVDNADDPQVLEQTPGTIASGRGWIRPITKGPGLVIVTSRRGADHTQWGRWIAAQPVKMLDPTDGAQVLLDYTHGRGGTEPEARRLAERLGGLPLALSLAGSYLAEAIRDPWAEPTTVTTFDGYRMALDEGRVDVLESPDGEDDNQLIDGIWQLATDLLKSRNLPLAAPFLRLLSQFANAPIPYQLLLNQATLTGSPIFADLDHAQIRSLLRYTADLDLIDLPPATTQEPGTVEPPVLHVHPLMRDASHRYRDPVHSDGDYLALAAKLLVAATADEPDTSPRDHRRWPFWHLLAPHVFHFARSLKVVERPLGEKLAHSIDLSARYLHFRGLWSQSETEFRNMYHMCGEALGVEHPRTLAARWGIAFCLGESGKYGVAQVEYQAVIEARHRVLGAEHPDTLMARHSLASVLQDRGKYAESQAEFQAVLEIQRQVLGEEHSDTLSTRHNLALVLRQRGNLTEAQAEFQLILEARRRIFGDGHLEILATRHNLAGVLKDRGHYGEAHAELRAILEIEQQVLGVEHPNTLTTRFNLASAYLDVGNVRAAQAEMKAVLTLREKVLGYDHLYTCDARNFIENLKRIRTAVGKPVLWHGPGKRKKKKKK